MKKYTAPEIDVVKFSVEDIITVSGGNGENNTNDDDM